MVSVLVHSVIGGGPAGSDPGRHELHRSRGRADGLFIREGSFESAAENQVPLPGQFHERTPNPLHQPVLDQEMPESI